MAYKITEVFMWVAQDSDEEEGVVAGEMTLEGRRMFVPLVTAATRMLPNLKEQAVMIQDQTGKPMCLKRFVFSEIIDELPVS